MRICKDLFYLLQKKLMYNIKIDKKCILYI